MTRQKPGNRFGKVFRSISDNAEGYLLFVLAIMLVLDVLLGILARYVRFEVVFATELGKYIFIWLCAIGISAAAKDNQHVRMDFLAAKLPISRRVIWVVSQVLFLIFALFFFYWGLKLTLMHIELNKSAMGFRFPMFIFTAALPIGYAFTCFRLIQDLVRSLRGSDRSPSWEPRASSGLGGITDEE